MPFDSTGAGQGDGIASRFSHKYGPLPLWGWMLALLGVALAWSAWKSKKTASSSTSSTDASADDSTGGNQYPPIVFQDYDTIITNGAVPPGGGRPHPPNPAPAPTPVTTLPIGDPVSTPPPRVTPPGTPSLTTPAPAQPAGEWVTVAKWTSSNTAWNSTLWGIAKHYGYGAGSNNWTSIWNDAQNASLKSRRKDPTKIQPGDRIFVPKK